MSKVGELIHVPTGPVVSAERSVFDGRLLTVLKQFPFKFAAGVAVATGCVLLHMYIAAIDYVPHDLLALVGYAGLACAWLLVLLVVTTLLMFGPAAAVHAYEVDNPPRAVLLAGQASGAFLLAAVVWLQPSYQLWLGIGSALFACLTLWFLASEKPRRSLWNMCLALIAAVGGGLSAFLGVLLLVQASGVGQPGFDVGWRLAAGGAALLMIFCINEWAATRRERLTIVWGMCAAVVALLFVCMTKWWYVPTVIATRIGLALPGLTMLSVNRATCDRLMAVTERTRPHNDAGPVPQCSEAANYVTGNVQLRWSARWLVSLHSINGMQISKSAPRVLIPDEGAILLLPPSTADR